MTAVSVWIPNELAATVKAQLPRVNVSRTLQEALQRLLGCEHHELVCGACSTAIPRVDVVAPPLAAFYADVMGVISVLSRRPGMTVEGVARAIREIGRNHGVAAADVTPLPALTDAERRSRRAG